MAIAPTVFKVITDFKFEIGSAILGSNRLTDSINQISSAAENAQFSLARMGIGIGTSLGIIPGSILGAIGSAIMASEDFQQVQLSLSNLLSANKEYLVGTIDTFNDRLMTSSTIMRDIAGQAKEFGLPQKELLDMTKTLGAMLIPKSLAGTNLKEAINMSRNLLKSAPNLGIDPREVQGQLLRSIEGSASMGDTLFRRLLSETKVFEPYRKSGTKGFNELDAAKRVKILSEALGQFASDVDVLETRVSTLTGQFQILKDNIKGFTGILKPIGDALRDPIIKALGYINQIIDKEGRAIANNLANILNDVLANPRKLLVNLFQIQQLGSDVKKTGNLFAVAGTVTAIGHTIKMLGGTAMFANPILGGLIIGFGLLFDVMGRMGASLGMFLKVTLGVVGVIAGLIFSVFKFKLVFGLLALVFKTVFFPLTLIISAMQILSRAQAYAKVIDLERLPAMMERWSALTVRLKDAIAGIFQPITRVFDAIAKFIAPIFSKTILLGDATSILEKFIGVFEWLAKVVLLAQAGFQGLVFAIAQFVDNIMTIGERLALKDFKAVMMGDESIGAVLEKAFNFKAVGEAMNAGIDDFIAENIKNLGTEKGFVAQMTTNLNGNVVINNQFKENLEPDRIAFTLKDQILKIAQNPTQARNRNFGFQGAS